VGHRTGIGTIINNTDTEWKITHLESGKVFLLGHFSNISLSCDLIFGWVSNSSEMEQRALEFRTLGGGDVVHWLMFQTFATSEIAFVVVPGTFETRVNTGVVAGCAGVTIDGTLTAFRIF
jgi:hypothetical protein